MNNTGAMVFASFLFIDISKPLSTGYLSIAVVLFLISVIEFLKIR